MGFNFFPQNDQVCPLCRPCLCLGLFGVLLPRTLPLQVYNYNHNYDNASTLQTVQKEGSQTRTPPTQTYNHNNNYTSTPQKVPKEGGPPRAKPLQAYNHSYSYTSTLQNAPQEGGPTRTLPPQTYNHNYTSALQKIEEKPLPVSVIKANQWKLLLPTKLSQVRVLPYVLPWPQQSQ